MARSEGGVVELSTAHDPRFDPESDEANALAHGEDEAGAKEADDVVGRVQDTVKAAIEEARNFYTAELEPLQVTATDYYMGRPFGNEKENRSQVVNTTLRDVTLSQIPSLLRIIWNDERAVEFVPRRLDKEPEAKWATDYARLVIAEDNPGFLSTIAVLKDALVRKLGYWKLWWETTHRRERHELTGLSEDDITLLGNQDDVDQIEITGEREQTLEVPGAGQQLVTVFDATVTRTLKEGCARVREVPPEEVGWTPDARDLESAACVYHSRLVPVDYLYARGIDPDLIEEALEKSKDNASSGDLRGARQFHGGTKGTRNEEALDESQKQVLFTEAYILIDVGEDYGDEKPALAERRRFDCIGPEFVIANGDGLGECVDEVPIVSFTPEVEPHTIAGLSNHDLLEDIQLIKSQIERAQLDSLAEAVNPVTVIVAGEVNAGDLTKPDTSRIVRVRRDVNAIREVKSTYVGPDTMPTLAYYDEKIENRTGQEHGSAGLDADALQSTDKQGVASVLTAKQQRLEMIARVYAETTLKPLYKKLLRLLVKHQDKPRLVRLRGKYVEVDPRAWDATMDVAVNVALGQGTPQDRIALLGSVATAIKELMGTGSPLVSNVELRRVLGRAAELAGYPNSEEFFKPWGPEEEKQYQQMLAQQPPPESPEMALVAVEKMKAEADIDFKKMEADRKEREMALLDDRERDRTAHELALKERELELKYGAQIADAQQTALVQKYRHELDAETNLQTALLQSQSPEV